MCTYLVSGRCFGDFLHNHRQTPPSLSHLFNKNGLNPPWSIVGFQKDRQSPKKKPSPTSSFHHIPVFPKPTLGWPFPAWSSSIESGSIIIPFYNSRFTSNATLRPLRCHFSSRRFHWTHTCRDATLTFTLLLGIPRREVCHIWTINWASRGGYTFWIETISSMN